MILSDLDDRKALALIEEMKMSIDLLMLGLEKLRDAEKDDRIHLPIQILSLGYERLFKCLLMLDYLKSNNTFPNDLLWEKGSKGHDILELHKKLVDLPIFNQFAEKCEFINSVLKLTIFFIE